MVEVLLERSLLLPASGGCYAKHESNQWWACEDYQTPNGVATACTPINF